MSTITKAAPVSQPSSPAHVLTEGGDQRTVFRGVDRHAYDQLSEAAGEGRPLRLVYDGIDMCPPQVDRPAIYRDLGVAEVWRLVRGQELIIEQLQADGSYAPVEESRFLQIRGDVVLRWLNEAATEDEVAWNRRLIQWAMGLGQQG